jgi:hypothetical protein
LKKIELALFLSLGLTIPTSLVVGLPKAEAHGGACGCTCVDLGTASGEPDPLHQKNDQVCCSEYTAQSPPDSAAEASCGCFRVPGHYPDGVEGPDPIGTHMNAVAVSGYIDAASGTVEGCVDVNGEAGVSEHLQDQEIDAASCHEAAGNACLEHGCYTVKKWDLPQDQIAATCGGGAH